MLSIVLIKTRNAPILTMKIRHIEYYTVFFNSTLWKIRCSLNPKAQAVNKAQRHLRPDPYFPNFFKQRTQYLYKFFGSSLTEIFLFFLLKIACPETLYNTYTQSELHANAVKLVPELEFRNGQILFWQQHSKYLNSAISNDLSFYLSIYLYTYIYLFIYLYIFLSIYLSIYLSICIYIYISISLHKPQ